MQITLSQEQSRILESLFQQGDYESLETMIDAALLLLAEQLAERTQSVDPDYLAWMEKTRLKLDAGIDDMQENRTVPLEAVLTQLQDKVTKAQAESA
ncbi:MAG: hypothetical protein AAF685_09800 [Cyanobacteria bacterium P01_C01_bin.89]